MEREIGTIFKYKDAILKVIEDKEVDFYHFIKNPKLLCEECYFKGTDNCSRFDIKEVIGDCSRGTRRGVHFKELKINSDKNSFIKTEVTFVGGRILQYKIKAILKEDQQYEDKKLINFIDVNKSLHKFLLSDIEKITLTFSEDDISVFYEKDKPKPKKKSKEPKQITKLEDLDGLSNGHGLTLKCYKKESKYICRGLSKDRKERYFTIFDLNERAVRKLKNYGFNISFSFNLDNFLSEYVKPYTPERKYKTAFQVDPLENKGEFIPIQENTLNLWNTNYFSIESLSYVNKVLFLREKIKLEDMIAALNKIQEK